MERERKTGPRIAPEWVAFEQPAEGDGSGWISKKDQATVHPWQRSWDRKTVLVLY